MVVSGGGERLFSHSFKKSDEYLLMLLGARLLSSDDGSSPSLSGDPERRSMEPCFMLLPC